MSDKVKPAPRRSIAPMPCGSWKSPVSTQLMTRGAVGLGQVFLDGDRIAWTELRPWEQGRTVLMRATLSNGGTDESHAATPMEITPAPANVRSKVHEYGGGAAVMHDGSAYYIEARNQRVHRVGADGAARPLSEGDGTAYADFVVDAARERLIAVGERARDGGEPENFIGAIGLEAGVRDLVTGADFYAAPKLSPDGSRLAWVEWMHPNMPWDESVVKEATLDADGVVASTRTVAGGPGVSVFQPEYAPDGTLYYCADPTGFWQIYRDGDAAPLCPVEAEFGLPHWQFGMRVYAFLDARWIVAAHAVAGNWHLGLIDAENGTMRELDLSNYGDWCGFDGLIAGNGRVAFKGARMTGPDAIVAMTLDPEAARVTSFDIVKAAMELSIPVVDIACAETVAFPSGEDGRTAYGFFYPPVNGAFSVPEGERPPLIVMSHGGPTGQTGKGFSLKVQFWTSRGFAVLDVNYSGSTGYGRAYRERLAGNWGIVDVEDCCAGARFLAGKGRVDPDRLIIVGGSAGGYTTLSALTFTDVFRAGRSSYGIGDLEALAKDTHKFESRYLDKLVGPWPEAAEVYRARSPLHHTDALNCPILFLQGAEDKVVPPNQAEAMVDALREKGLPVAYLLMEGEGHGFRRAENVKAAFNAELSFYARIFGFTPADDLPDLEVENLD